VVVTVINMLDTLATSNITKIRDKFDKHEHEMSIFINKLTK